VDRSWEYINGIAFAVKIQYSISDQDPDSGLLNSDPKLDPDPDPERLKGFPRRGSKRLELVRLLQV
jgi:hypothetical protein